MPPKSRIAEEEKWVRVLFSAQRNLINGKFNLSHTSVSFFFSFFEIVARQTRQNRDVVFHIFLNLFCFIFLKREIRKSLKYIY